MLTFEYRVYPEGDTSAVNEQLQLTRRYYNALVVVERERMIALAMAGDDEEMRKQTHLEFNARVCDAWAASGCYAGNRYPIREAIGRAVEGTTLFDLTRECRCPRCKETVPAGASVWWRKSAHRVVSCRECGPPLRFRNRDHDHSVAVELNGGLPCSALVGDELDRRTDTRIRVEGEGKHRTLFMRVKSDGRAPVWARFKLVYHRPLPDGVIRWAKIIRHKVGVHWKWKCQFVVDCHSACGTATGDTIAIDVGWRRLEDGSLRVATWVDSDGQSGELKLSAELMRRFAKIEDLRSIRDLSMKLPLSRLLEAREAQTDWPEELLQLTATAHQWRSQERLADLSLRLRGSGHPQPCDWDPLDRRALIPMLEEWRKRDKHLHAWESHQRERVLRQRREIYRLFALHCARYRRVVIERMNLACMKEKDLNPNEPWEVVAAHGRRQIAAVGTLYECVVHAQNKTGSELLDLPAAKTTSICASCGVENEWDRVELEHACSACGVRFDQDFNAARNLLKAALDGDERLDRSKRQVRKKKEETKAHARRIKGLATQRANRSKSTEQTSESIEEIK
jgi:hypothetical protein